MRPLHLGWLLPRATQADQANRAVRYGRMAVAAMVIEYGVQVRAGGGGVVVVVVVVAAALMVLVMLVLVVVVAVLMVVLV